MADQISDAIVDLYLSKDPVARVACETLVTTNRIILAGEVRSAVPVTEAELEQAARNVVRRIGYAQDGFHWWFDAQPERVANNEEGEVNYAYHANH